jgi:hypothetical protein
LGYGPDVNLYRYVGNNPLRWIDPFGLDKAKPWWEKLEEGYYYGTAYGEYATNWYASQQIATGNPLWAIPGSVAALWTPSTYQKTGWTLVGAATISATGIVSGPTPGPAVSQLSGFTKHGINQVISRGIPPAAILQTLKSPQFIAEKVDQLGRVSYQYVGEQVVIVLNKAAQVITAWLK